PTIGYVSLEHTFDIGNTSSAEIYEISLGINGYYTNNANCSDATIINIYKPEGDFITGGGFIIEENSYGIYSANGGRKTNFGFNVKFNKKGTNLSGKMTIIVRRLESDGIVHIYRFKTNATESLGINLGGEGECDLAEFTSKANLTDVTDPLNPIEIMGNLQLQATLTDCGEPGSSDKIGVTIWDGNILLFSSNWNGVETIEQLLDGGNLKVQSGTDVGSSSQSKNNKSALLHSPESFKSIDIKVYPNPSRGPVTLDFGSTGIQNAEVVVISLTGAEVFRKEYKMTTKVQLDMSDYISGLYTIRMNLDGNHFTRKLILKNE
ncbi:T9SS type A sorting domain-containing protein, partial [Mariniphaga sp.]|uniref:T9SS type A sorting domain-containing protein n=1 Tax=Mariniphaga sp. TaxID=1954475 RepID=UPI00356A48F3